MEMKTPLGRALTIQAGGPELRSPADMQNTPCSPGGEDSAGFLAGHPVKLDL